MNTLKYQTMVSNRRIIKPNPTVTKSHKNNIVANLSKDMEPQSWAPELINSRCAMIGITSGVGYEIVEKIPIYKQAEELWPAYITTVLIVTLATLYN